MPLGPTGAARKLSETIHHTADLVGRLEELQPSGRHPARPHPEVERVAARFERINQTLQKALDAGYLSAAQERSIAGNLEAMAEALEKAASSTR